jgi:hypothetical protein
MESGSILSRIIHCELGGGIGHGPRSVPKAPNLTAGEIEADRLPSAPTPPTTTRQRDDAPNKLPVAPGKPPVLAPGGYRRRVLAPATMTWDPHAPRADAPGGRNARLKPHHSSTS